MSLHHWNRLAAVILVPALSLGLITLSGCDSADTQTAAPQETHDDHDHDEHDHDHDDHDHGDVVASTDHDHSGWWCNEHGVPEHECALCKTSLITDFKAQGDWCEEHNRPDSQCFVCHPENFEIFAVRYEAKFGEKPPKPTE